VGLVVDSDERLFVTGTKIAPQGQHYIVTLGYDRETGSRLSFPTTYSYGDACAIAADRNGHIYVAGQDQDSGDVVTLQYDAGDFVANAHPAPNWNVPGDIGQSVAPVAMKTFGTSIYVTGAATDNNHNGSFALFKYNDQGAEQWVQLDGAGEGLDHPTDMAIDSAGNIYVTGYAQGGINPQTNQTENDYLTLKYTPAGALARFWMYGSNGDRSDVSTAIGIDGHNRVFVTGYSQNVNSDAYDAFTGRLDPLGGFTWTRRFIGTANRTCAARRIAVSNDNSVYVVGTQISAEQQADFQISKYRWDGAVLW
jgi:hypothetical protein